ncbi:MAG TPA: cob(I)yrinic acid a,c-diamide adenosyltransferase [Acidobacteriaceae bacterium]|jgi:cob(I)alamin adenosyltransferase|nr:cob(I)yrinic acid a,c-diamide adenosyltransferase [Acidobacteriaceae bacterium]
MSDISATPEASSRRGLILINTGPGKGKTTAALGTAFRAAGNGMRVLFLQFLKGSWHYGELDAAQALNAALTPALGSTLSPEPDATSAAPAPEHFVVRQLGRGFVKVGGAETDPEDVRMVEEAWAQSAAAILSGDWDLVVLDEINYAIGYKMLEADAVADVLKRKPEMTHVILTGRNAHPLLIELADTVTEMRDVKHAYQKGILAQRGIEF